ncbi:MAG TPA: response regulator [Chitinophagaceae bacterium]|nr:response regulator [Chitinophagaceae bacterium]
MKNPGIIAVVDDDTDDLELITEAFLHADKGLEIRTYSSGRQLFNALCADQVNPKPSLFIIDYNMPEQGGPEIIELLCADPKYLAVPKIVLSTSDSQLYQRICKDKGADHYFKKPNNFDQWVRMATEILEIMKSV